MTEVDFQNGWSSGHIRKKSFLDVPLHVFKGWVPARCISKSCTSLGLPKWLFPAGDRDGVEVTTYETFAMKAKDDLRGQV